MRPLLIALAALALVAIGTAEAAESARQLAELPGRGRPTLAPGGAALTLIGLALSISVFATLGIALERTGSSSAGAARDGAIAGLAAGLVGGTIRALAVSDYLGEVMRSFGLATEFLVISLAIFVALGTAATGAAGAALTWLSFRLARSRRTPRPPR